MWPERRRRRWPWVASGLVGLLLLPLVAAGLLVALVPPPTPPDRYVEAIAGEPPLLNPILAPYSLAGQDLIPLVFASLTRTDAVGNVQLDLAGSLDVEEGGHAYRVRLRDGLVWDDGRPLTAEDVRFTVQLIQDADHQGSQELAALWRGIELDVIDSQTVQFRLPTPLASFPEHLTLGLLPRHALDGVTAATLPLHPFNRQPVGSGPYHVASFDPGRLVLERNPRYHGPSPNLGTLEMRVYTARTDAVQALLSGEVDGLAGLRPDEFQQAAVTPNTVLYAFPERSKTATVLFNLDEAILHELSVRRALAHTLDRERLIRDALDGQGEPAVGPIPVQSWAYARVPTAAEYDPARAAQLLTEAGWQPGPDGIRQRDGTPLTLTLLTANLPERLAVARALAAQAQAVGVKLEVSAVPADEFVENYLEHRRFQAALVGQWSVGSDPDAYPQWHSSQIGTAGGNYAGFNDADVDKWLEVGRQESDREVRRNAYLHFQARWAEAQPALVLYHPVAAFVATGDVCGIAADPLPDSSWRLRQMGSWQRVARPTGWQEARAKILARASLWPGLPGDAGSYIPD
jgi:peptide/nickel transport system substrate-binding protein